MNIHNITQKSEWDSFFEKIGSPSFHQSWEWGEFQKKIGYEIMRLGLYDNNKLELIALVVKIRSKRGSFLFIPHGPLFNIQTDRLSQWVSDYDAQHIKSNLCELRNYLIPLAKQQGFWFIRMAPILARSHSHDTLCKSLGFRTAPTYMHVETMWIVDVTQSEDELLKNMRKNTRYSIRRAMRDKISVTKHATINAMKDFWTLYKKTSDREKFIPYSKTYLTYEFESFHEYNNALFFFGGFHNNLKLSQPRADEPMAQTFAQEDASKKIAGSLVIFSKSSGFYHQGASIHTQYQASYLLQWESILESKKRGCHYYCLHGIHDPGRTPKSWVGLSLFKRGFGGFQVDYLHTQDYIVSPLYYLSYGIDKYLTWRRGV